MAYPGMDRVVNGTGHSERAYQRVQRGEKGEFLVYDWLVRGAGSDKFLCTPAYRTGVPAAMCQRVRYPHLHRKSRITEIVPVAKDAACIPRAEAKVKWCS